MVIQGVDRVIKSQRTILSSVRINENLYQTGELLKERHPHMLSQSRIYYAGLKTIITELIEKGAQIPDDAIGALINLKKNEIEDLEQEIKNLMELQKKQVAVASRTLAGKPEPVVAGLKPGYEYVDGVDERGNKIKVGREISYD